jgi:putative redox protein
MIQIDISYQGELRCQAVHGPTGQTLTTDAPVATRGKGEHFSPTDLVAAALGTCILTIIAGLANRENIDLTGVKISVAKEMASAPQRHIGKLITRVTMPCTLTDQQKAKFERAAHLCPVHESLRPDIEMPIEFIYP